MSYEIIKSIKIIETKEKTIAVVESAANNVYPRHYYKWELGKNNNYTKEEIEKLILWLYFSGDFNGGSNKYKKLIDRIGNWSTKKTNVLNKWYEYEEEKTNAYNDKTKNYHEESKRIEEKYNGYKTMRNYVADILYKVLKDEIIADTPKYILKTKNNYYVMKLNNRTYYTTAIKEQAQIFNGYADLYKSNIFEAIAV